VEALAATADVTRHTFAGAGHVPHLTHPADHVAVTRSFMPSTRSKARTTGCQTPALVPAARVVKSLGE
ncbi:MAG TPA: hypothetical protein VEX40_18655, partial [Mycobacterium sp.]|nr:hypothetical protein [Mycobacterium sp.]